MRVKQSSAAVLLAFLACAGFANAQISMPSGSTALGLPVAGPTQSQTPGIVTLGEAAMASNPPTKEVSATAAPASPASPVAPTPARIAQPQIGPAASQANLPQGGVATTSGAPAPNLTGQQGPIATNMQQSAAPLPTPFPTALGPQPRPRPDIELLRISTKNGQQQVTLYVRGMTRSGLTVGSKVLKQVISEFREDGVCLDASLHRPKCATFITGNSE